MMPMEENCGEEDVEGFVVDNVNKWFRVNYTEKRSSTLKDTLKIWEEDVLLTGVSVIFYVMCFPQTLSLFPPRILRLLEFAGFSGDKVQVPV